MASLATIRVGDIVLAEVKGRRTYALVTDKSGGKLGIRPINDRTFTWRSVAGRHVVEHFRRTKNVRKTTVNRTEEP